jgi:hypothetical protein
VTACNFFLHAVFYCAQEAQNTMIMVNSFLAVGSYENWKGTFAKGNIWGVGERRYATWNKVAPGDTLFCYAEQPIKAVVAYGTVVSNFHDDAPFFAEDWRPISEWPWRFSIDLRWPSVSRLWESLVSVGNLQLTLHRGFQRLSWRNAQELLRRCISLGM